MAARSHPVANNLAARQTLRPSTSLGPGKEETILQYRGRDRNARNLNIVLAPVLPDPSPGPVIPPCVAIIAWGTGGASTKTEVDFARGTELQLAASFVAISGRNDGSVDDGTGHAIDDSAGPQDVVAIISGAGSRAAFGRATRTFYFANVAPAAIRLVPVSAFAKTILVTRFPANSVRQAHHLRRPGPEQRPRRRDADAGRPRGTSTPSRPAFPPPRLELFARAGAVAIANTGSAPIQAIQVSYELCL